MAKSRPKTQRTKPPTSAAQLERVLFYERLRSSAVPAALAIVAVLLWLLNSVDLVSSPSALLLAGAAVLLAVLHVGLRDFADERTSRSTGLAVIAFAIVWAAVAFYAFDAVVDPGQPLFSTQLATKAPPVNVSLGGVPGPYKIVVEGHPDASLEHVSHSVHYRVKVAGATDENIEGDFSDRWTTRRLGRRGSAPVHIVRAQNQHTVESRDGGDLQLSLEEITKGAQDSVNARVYRDAFHVIALTVVGVLLTAAAFVIDSWREVDGGETLMTNITLAVFFAIALLRRFGSAQPGFGDLVFNGAVGALGGLVGGYVLARASRIARPRKAKH